MPFHFESTPIDGLVIITPKAFGDARGFFLESYRRSVFSEHGIALEFRQDNHSRSSRGVLRGLHYQRPPMDQAKLVRVVTGRVWDVAVDLRAGSPTRGKWYGIELSAASNIMFYVPAGFAHGFVTMENDTTFLYKCTNEYSPVHEGGIRYDDPDVGITWPTTDVLVSNRDQGLPYLRDIDDKLVSEK